jgi:hypothetical protein
MSKKPLFNIVYYAIAFGVVHVNGNLIWPLHAPLHALFRFFSVSLLQSETINIEAIHCQLLDSY